MSVAFQPVYS